MSAVWNKISTAVRSINWADVRRNTILLAWLVTGVAALVIPLAQWYSEKRQYYKYYGYYVEYEQQQQEYEEQQNGNNNNNNGNYNSYYKDCGWWNVVCRSKQAKYASYYGDNNDQNNQQIPNWFLWMGGETEQMRRWKEENTGVRQEEGEEGNTAGQMVVAVWMMILFVGVLAYGAYTLYHRKPRTGLVVAMVAMLQVILLNVLLLPSLISTEGRMFEDSVYGWYGQTGVLMAYFDLWAILFSLGFLVLFIVTARLEKRNSTSSEGTDEEQQQAGAGDYYQAPSIQMTKA